MKGEPFGINFMAKVFFQRYAILQNQKHGVNIGTNREVLSQRLRI